jgi:hypothetical protein
MCQYLRHLRNGGAGAKKGTFDVFSVNLLKFVIVLYIWFYISIFAFEINNLIVIWQRKHLIDMAR